MVTHEQVLGEIRSLARENGVRAPAGSIALGLFLLATSPALPQEAPHRTGTVLLCETKEQAAVYAIYYRGDPYETVVRVNDDAGSAVCGLLSVVYVPGKIVATVDTKDGATDVQEVTVLALVSAGGVQQVPPSKQYTLIQSRD